MDLVGTYPKRFWKEWLAEGDCAGDKPSGSTYHWQTGSALAFKIKPGERFYVVAHERLRGYAIVVGVASGFMKFGSYTIGLTSIVRSGDARAVTIPEPVPEFRGLRKRWWDRADEIPFPDWKTP